MKKYQTKVTFDGWDWQNIVTITSPKTNKIIIFKANWSEEISPEIKKFFSYMNDAWQEGTFGVGIQITYYKFTKSELIELFNIANRKK